MQCDGKFKKIEVEINDDKILKIKKEHIIGFNCVDVADAFILNSEYDEKNAYDIVLLIKKEADVFINKDELKGTLFSVLEKNIINAIRVYTDSKIYRFIVPQKIVDINDCWLQSNGKFLSKIKGYGEEMNIAQTYGRDDEGNFMISISANNIENAYAEEDYYD